MDATIFLFLLQDGIINGAVYALVAIATVLVFAVTRVILVPQGEFVAFTALTIAALENGNMPSTPYPGLPALKPTMTGRLQKKRVALMRCAWTSAPCEKPNSRIFSCVGTPSSPR